jgi:CysZ protein
MLLALTRALVSLVHPKMLLLMIWPLLVAILIWIGVAYFFWAEAAQWVNMHFSATDTVQWMMQIWPFALFAAHLAFIVLAIAMVPCVLLTAVLIIGIFAMPTMVTHVSSGFYPTLVAKEGGTFLGSVGNAGIALLVFVGLAVATLPLWLAPLFWPVLPVLLLAYFNYRVFRYDALAEHASAQEMALIFREDRSRLFALGVAVSLAGHVPILGFFAPVYGGLVFIHYGLERLQRLRRSPVTIEGISVPG